MVLFPYTAPNLLRNSGLKDSGLERFPLSDFDANSAWPAQVGFAAELVFWFQLRWRLWHAPARLVRSGRRSILRVQGSWPDAKALLSAYRRIARLS